MEKLDLFIQKYSWIKFLRGKIDQNLQVSYGHAIYWTRIELKPDNKTEQSSVCSVIL